MIHCLWCDTPQDDPRVTDVHYQCPGCDAMAILAAHANVSGIPAEIYMGERISFDTLDGVPHAPVWTWVRKRKR